VEILIATVESAAADKATSDTKLAEQIERSQKIIDDKRIMKAKKSELATIDSLMNKVTRTENKKKALLLEIEALKNPTPLTQSVIEKQSPIDPPKVTTTTPKLKASSAPAPAAQPIIPQQAL